MIKYLFFCCFIIQIIGTDCLAQISPPGLGTANSAGWFALGVRQELDTIEGKGWQSMSYIGLGRKSNPDNYAPLYKPALLVVNQEFYHQFHNHWQYSFALSYRTQNEYLDKYPYSSDKPSTKQEFRIYSRFSYALKTSRIKFSPTLRQEFRKFYNPNFKTLSENFQFRSRLRFQLSINLTSKKTHKLIISSEHLFSISKKTAPNSWTAYNYNESRLSVYYSLSPKTLPLIFSVGYMNNLIGNTSLVNVHYLAFDIIIKNPFKQQQRAKENLPENLE